MYRMDGSFIHRSLLIVVGLVVVQGLCLPGEPNSNQRQGLWKVYIHLDQVDTWRNLTQI